MDVLLLLPFTPSSLTVRERFAEPPLLSFDVVPALDVAPLGVLLLPLHASLSACNLDMPLPAIQEGRLRRHSKPALSWFCASILHASSGGLIYRTFHTSYLSTLNILFRIHLLSRSELSCSFFCKKLSLIRDSFTCPCFMI
jgi:hypothetical protein